MNVVCTGISKCDKMDYFKETQEFSNQLHEEGKGTGVDIELYSIGDIMKDCLGPNTTVNKHILNKDDDQLSAAAGEAIKTLKIKLLEDKIAGKEETHNIISTHTTFIWQNHWKDSYNEQFLEILEPDLFVTIMEHEKRIQERQHKDPQWKLQKLDLPSIALWQDREVRETEKWAKRFGKRHIVFGRNQDPESLYKVINFPKAPIIYSNFPMTFLENVKESYAKITENNLEMMKYGTVIDPRTIEIMKPGEGGDYSYSEIEQQMKEMIDNKLGNNKRLNKLEQLVQKQLEHKKNTEIDIIKRLTVHRDLDFYVNNVDVDVLYFPELVLSFGGVAEIIKAYRSAKETHLIFPEGAKKVGPFEVYHSLNYFFGRDSYHEFLKERFEPLNIY